MANYYMIVNPVGGHSRGLSILESIKPVFEKAGASLTIKETRYPGHARILANTLELEGFDGLCAIGGDGTMHELINGVLSREDEQKVPLGLVTGGTGNSLMHDLDCLDPVLAAKRIITGRKRPIDIAKVDANGEIIYGFNIVGWGLATDVNIVAEKLRFLRGQRYNVAAIVEVLRYRQRLAKLIIDDRTLVGDYGFIIGCNTIHTGNAMKMAPLAQIDDGLIDLITVKKAGRLKLLSLFGKLFKGGHIGDPSVDYRQARSFSIIPLGADVLNIDGELLGNTPIHVTLLPKEIDLLV